MNFLSLVNAVCQRTGEVELSASNFASAKGIHGQIKQAVNASLSTANESCFEWFFNNSTQTITRGAYE